MKTLFFTFTTVLALFVISGCQPKGHLNSHAQQGAQGSDVTGGVETAELLKSRELDGRHLQKIETLIILIDDSSRLLARQGNSSIRTRALNLVNRINASLEGRQVHKAIRIFGPHADRNSFATATLYGMVENRAALKKPVIVTIAPEGTIINPLATALEATYHELKEVEGRTAIVMLSDFNTLNSEFYSTMDMMTQYYGDRVCTYGIFLGEEKNYSQFLNKILGIDACGFFTQEKSLEDPNLLADYLEKIIFDIIPEIKTIVVPVVEEIPQPEVAEAVELPVEPVEPDPVVVPEPVVVPPPPKLTYETLQVEKELRVELKTEFDFGKSFIRPEYVDHLQAIAEFMKTYPDTTTVVEGHTCDLGSSEYNMKLSQQRADIVKAYLVDTFGVDASRVSTKAYGETKPKVENSNEAARKQNRRAEAVITTTIVEDVIREVPTENSELEDNTRFKEIDADTVLDNTTGLMWGSADNGADIAWMDAEKYCKDYRGGGFSDWRLATQAELKTLYTPEEKNTDDFYLSPKIHLTECCMWASDVSMNSAGIFSFKTGKRPWGYQADSYKLRALPVRSTSEITPEPMK